MGVFGWDYPPGVTGNEPQITGEWPCDCGDGCEKVPTDCCDDQYECETVVGTNSTVSDDDRVRVCAVGFGCAYDTQVRACGCTAGDPHMSDCQVMSPPERHNDRYDEGDW
jgi:hypothetical protein